MIVLSTKTIMLASFIHWLFSFSHSLLPSKGQGHGQTEKRLQAAKMCWAHTVSYTISLHIVIFFRQCTNLTVDCLIFVWHVYTSLLHSVFCWFPCNNCSLERDGEFRLMRVCSDIDIYHYINFLLDTFLHTKHCISGIQQLFICTIKLCNIPTIPYIIALLRVEYYQCVCVCACMCASVHTCVCMHVCVWLLQYLTLCTSKWYRCTTIRHPLLTFNK